MKPSVVASIAAGLALASAVWNWEPLQTSVQRNLAFVALAKGSIAQRDASRLKRARSLFQALNTARDRDAAGYRGLGLTLLASSDAQAAASALAAAANEDSTPLTQFWLGEARLRAGDDAGAAEAWRLAAGGNSVASVRLAHRIASGGFPDRAVAELSRGLSQQQLGPAERFRLLLALCDINIYRWRKPEETEAYASEAVRLEPGSARAHLQLGWACLQLGKYECAKAESSQALDLGLVSNESYEVLGRSLLAAGHPAPAAAALEKSVSINSAIFAPHFELGRAYAMLGNTAAAAAQYRRALEISPASAEVEQALNSLPDGQDPTAVPLPLPSPTSKEG